MVGMLPSTGLVHLASRPLPPPRKRKPDTGPDAGAPPPPAPSLRAQVYDCYGRPIPPPIPINHNTAAPPPAPQPFAVSQVAAASQPNSLQHGATVLPPQQPPQVTDYHCYYYVNPSFPTVWSHIHTSPYIPPSPALQPYSIGHHPSWVPPPQPPAHNVVLPAGFSAFFPPAPPPNNQAAAAAVAPLRPHLSTPPAPAVEAPPQPTSPTLRPTSHVSVACRPLPEPLPIGLAQVLDIDVSPLCPSSIPSETVSEAAIVAAVTKPAVPAPLPQPSVLQVVKALGRVAPFYRKLGSKTPLCVLLGLTEATWSWSVLLKVLKLWVDKWEEELLPPALDATLRMTKGDHRVPPSVDAMVAEGLCRLLAEVLRRGVGQRDLVLPAIAVVRELATHEHHRGHMVNVRVGAQLIQVLQHHTRDWELQRLAIDAIAALARNDDNKASLVFAGLNKVMVDCLVSCPSNAGMQVAVAELIVRLGQTSAMHLKHDQRCLAAIGRGLHMWRDEESPVVAALRAAAKVIVSGR